MPKHAAKRKLTTILAADVVGYSRMMEADDEGTLATLRSYRQITDDLVAKHDGRVFSAAGDAFMAEFGSAVDAVRCAIAIQEDLAVRNAELPRECRMLFRIGINVGDVMVEGGNLFGDGVNVAARLEGLAAGGGICISGTTFQQVKNKVSVAFNDIGAQRVKNISEPVAAFQVVPSEAAIKRGRSARTGRGRRIVLASAGALATGAALGYGVGWLPPGSASSGSFDGRWQVQVSELSGCLDNSPRGFPVVIRGGEIDMPNQPYPKSGEVSDSGKFTIRASDPAGSLVATQVGTITGETGEGTFRGRHARCTGRVRIIRAD